MTIRVGDFVRALIDQTTGKVVGWRTPADENQFFDHTEEPGNRDVHVDATALGLVDGDVVVARGRSAAGDGGSGGGAYTVTPVGTADNRTLFDVTGLGQIARFGRSSRGFDGDELLAWFDGASDDARLADAITYAETIDIPARTVTVTNRTFSKSMRIRGKGKRISVLQWQAGSAATNLFGFTKVSGDPIHVVFQDLTIDANYPSHTNPVAYYGSILLNAPAGSTLTLDNVHFLRGRTLDVYVVGSTVATPVRVRMFGCTWEDGMEGTAGGGGLSSQCASLVENVDLLADGNEFFLTSAPAGVGRAGIVVQRPSASASTHFGRVVATSNRFTNIGRNDTAALGCIDVYSGAKAAIIADNSAIDAYGRAFSAKADCASITINGNSVRGFKGSGPPIALFNQLDSVSSVGRVLNMCDNSVAAPVDALAGDGIYIDGGDPSGVSTFENVVATGNIADGAWLRGLRIRRVKQATVRGGSIMGAMTVGVSVEDSEGALTLEGVDVNGPATSVRFGGTSLASADITVRGGSISNAATRGIDIALSCRSYDIGAGVRFRNVVQVYTTTGSTEQSRIGGSTERGGTTLWSKAGTDTALEYVGDTTQLALPFAARNLNIVSGVVTAYADWHSVDTEGGIGPSDDVDTINGGREGQVVMFCAASNTRDIVFKDGTGNLRLAGDFTLTHSDDTITLRKRGAVWFEVSRSDNTA